MNELLAGWADGLVAYRSSSVEALVGIVLLLVLTLALGFWTGRIRSLALARPLSWGLAAGGFAAMNAFTWDEPGGLRMLSICGVVLYGMKAVVAVEERSRRGLALGSVSWLLWTAVWPGMRPTLFKRVRWKPVAGAGELLVKGVVRLIGGVLLLIAARAVWGKTGSLLAASALLLPALSLILHFGVFNLVAGALRLIGVPAQTLFPAPLASRSLGEFWGRRWNLPFTEMVQRALYRPLSKTLGKPRAAVVGFLFSGVLHEVAISVPVRAGYGLPMLYFLIHGGLTYLERRLEGSGWFLERSRVIAHVWTLGWLALPLPILFHRPFLEGVLWPLIGIPPGG